MPGTTDRVWADLALARVCVGTGETERGWRLAIHALDLARQGDDAELLYAAAGTAVMPLWGWDHGEERLRIAEDLSDRPREGASARMLGTFLFMGGVELLAWGRREQAEALWREQRELVGRTRDPFVILHAMRIDSWLAFLDGHLDEAVDVGNRLISRGEELGSPQAGKAFGVNEMFQPLIHLGRSQEALDAIVEGADLLRSGEPESLQEAVCLAHLGRREDAQVVLSELLGRLPAPGSSAGEPSSRALAHLLETAILVEDLDAAAALSERLRPLAERLASGGFGSICPARLLGAAAKLLGRPDEARAYSRQALEVCERVRFRPEIALTRLQIAELLLYEADSLQSAVSQPGADAEALQGGEPSSEGLRTEARQHLDFAIEEFRAMKMQPALERALRHKGLLKA